MCGCWPNRGVEFNRVVFAFYRTRINKKTFDKNQMVDEKGHLKMDEG